MNTLAHLFLPRSSNNHKAKVLHSSSLLTIAILFLVFQVFINFLQPKAPKVLGYAASISPFEVERLTNEKRAQNGLSSLTDNPTLDSAALAKGKDMLAKGYWAHVAPDGTQPWSFFVSVGYEYKYAGENLARDFKDPQSAVEAWMASPTHKDNLLSPNYREIGIGVVEGNLDGVDTTIIVQFFGTKLGDTVPSSTIAQAKTQTISPTSTSIPSQKPISKETSVPLAVTLPTSTSTPTELPLPEPSAIVASSQTSPFELTRFMSLGLVGTLIVVVAVDGFLINKRKIYRIAGHFPAHIAFLAVILILVILAKVGKII